jgi:hypothetical protein
VSDVDKPDPVAARKHERAAERHRKVAERLRGAGLEKGEEAAKRVAREEDERAAAASPQPPTRSPEATPARLLAPRVVS